MIADEQGVFDVVAAVLQVLRVVDFAVTVFSVGAAVGAGLVVAGVAGMVRARRAGGSSC